VTTDLAVSACVDCGMTILGERPRCPACHDRHAAELIVAEPSDDDATAPRRHAGAGAPTILARWFVVAEMILIVVLGLVVAARGCTP
jgi:RNA polymerase subunit RPABC4/transcription elongation factor Spt4